MTTRHFASRAAADAYVVSQQVDALEQQCRLSGSQNARLISLRQQLNALASPIYKLSDDVLSLIFEYGSEDGKDTVFGLTISHTVSRWRQVAVATPRLWTSITMSIPLARTRRKDRTSTMIQRSSMCSIDLEIIVKGLMSPRVADTISDTLLPLFARCRRVSLSKSVCGRSLWKPPPPFIPIRTAPQLERLEICKVKLSQSFLSLLLACPNLRSLDLNGIDTMDFDEICAVNAAKLHDVSVQDSEQYVASVFLFTENVHANSLYSLKWLHYRFLENVVPQCTENLRNIRCFEYRTYNDAQCVLLKLIVLMPHLETLVISSTTFDPSESISDDLLPPLSKRVLSPSLSYVNFEFCKSIDAVVQAVVDMYSPDYKSGQDRIGRFKVCYCRPMADALLTWLTERVTLVEWEWPGS